MLLRRARIAAIGYDSRASAIRRARIPARRLLREAPVRTRMHVARVPVAAGDAGTTQDAFDRWLGRGAAGHVPQQWPDVEAAIGAIRAAGGHAVLAHPHRYRLSSGALHALCSMFREAGGAAMEVSLPSLSPNDAAHLARLARLHGLQGTGRSDFHDPACRGVAGALAKLLRTEPLARLLGQG